MVMFCMYHVDLDSCLQFVVIVVCIFVCLINCMLICLNLGLFMCFRQS